MSDTASLPPPPAGIRSTSGQDVLLAPPSSRRRLRQALIAAALVAAVVSAAALARAVWADDASVSASRLTLATVERGAFVRDVAGEGKVIAAASPTLYSADGGVLSLKVRAGDRVTRGQVLAVIDSPSLTARIAQEKSNADAMRADAQRAEIDSRSGRAALQSAADTARIERQTAENDLARQQKAFDAGAAAGMQVDHAHDTLEKARITHRNADDALALKGESLRFDVQSKRLAAERQVLLVAELQRQLEQLTVRAPSDGQVGQLLVADHASLSKDTPLMTVVDLTTLEVQMQVPENFARDLAMGMTSDISGNGQTWHGRVSGVSPEVVNNQVEARLRFDGEAPSQLRQNQRLQVRVLIENRGDVLSVRRGSFVDESGGAYAYVVRDSAAVKTAVRLGARSIDKVEVLSGLAAGDRIVISGAEAFQGAERAALSR